MIILLVILGVIFCRIARSCLIIGDGVGLLVVGSGGLFVVGEGVVGKTVVGGVVGEGVVDVVVGEGVVVGKDVVVGGVVVDDGVVGTDIGVVGNVVDVFVKFFITLKNCKDISYLMTNLLNFLSLNLLNWREVENYLNYLVLDNLINLGLLFLSFDLVIPSTYTIQ